MEKPWLREMCRALLAVVAVASAALVAYAPAGGGARTACVCLTVALAGLACSARRE